MERIPVQSSNLVSVGYDAQTSMLEIEFKNGTYQYDAVPESVYEELLNSPSKGQYFSQNIKEKYAFRKL